jgi:phage tail-like protein
MQKTSKCVNYCRLSLQDGSFHRVELTQGYTLTGQGGGYFAYLAPMFNTMELGCSFHRFRLLGEFRDCKYEVIAAASNVDISEALFAEETAPREQTRMLKELTYMRKVNCDDFLLHELEGRYLWIQIVISSAKADSCFEIDSFNVEFPQRSFVEYFPEVYQNQPDTFFYRYMAALQSLYENLEVRISEVPQKLDYEITDEENLLELSRWVGFSETTSSFTPEQLRILIRDLTEIQAGKGTGKVLKKMLELLTGKDVYVMEYFKWHDLVAENQGCLEDYSRNYGADETVFTVMIDFRQTKNEDLPSSQWMMKLIEEYMPFGQKCNLVYLRESNHFDMHCYLDVNSYLSTPVTADTSGFVLGGNYVLG